MRLPSMMFWLSLAAGLAVAVESLLAQTPDKPAPPAAEAKPPVPAESGPIPPIPPPPGPSADIVAPGSPADKTAPSGVGTSPANSAPGQSLRDPTSPSPMLRDLIDPGRNQPKSMELPLIQLRGRIIGGGQPSAAMLEIDKHSYLVRKGSEILFPGSRPGAQSIRVLDVTAEEVRLEILPLGRSVSLN